MAEKQDKIPIPALPLAPRDAKRLKTIHEKKAVSEQKKFARKEKRKAADKTRISLGTAIEPWNHLKETQGLKTHRDVALLLLDHYVHISGSIDVTLESYTFDDDSSPLTPEECAFQTPRTPPPPPDFSICAESLSDRQTSPSIDDVPKYIVDEDCLLQLFEECPACGSMCEVQKTTRGTFLALHQLCLKCHFSRNWKSQQTEMAVPSGDALSRTSDPESSAAAEVIGFNDKNDSLDEGSSEVDEEEHNSDSCEGYTPPLRHVSFPTCLHSDTNPISNPYPKLNPYGSVATPTIRSQFRSGDMSEWRATLSSVEGQNVEVKDDNYRNALDPLENCNVDDKLSDEGENGGDHTSDGDWDPPENLSSNSELDPLENCNVDDKLSDEGQNGGDHTCSDSDWDPPENRPRKNTLLCPECGIYFYKRKAHTCEYKKPYSCNMCGKRFLTEGYLKAHNKTHEDGYKHVCKYCFSTYRTRHNKLLHEQRHPPAKKPYQCPDCPEVFAKMLERSDHLLTHRGPTRHICVICNMEFSTNPQLQRHVVVHTKEKHFVCEVCQRSFTQPSHLKSHMRVHTGEKPYQCQHCDKSFNHNVSLKSHIQRYHGQVPDPGMKVQTEKNESELEKNETNEKESIAVDAEWAEPSKDTLCNAKNGGDNEEEKKEDKCTKTFKYSNYYRPTGRPIGRPKKNAVITLEDAKQLCIRNENEKDHGNSDYTDEEP